MKAPRITIELKKNEPKQIKWPAFCALEMIYYSKKHAKPFELTSGDVVKMAREQTKEQIAKSRLSKFRPQLTCSPYDRALAALRGLEAAGVAKHKKPRSFIFRLPDVRKAYNSAQIEAAAAKPAPKREKTAAKKKTPAKREKTATKKKSVAKKSSAKVTKTDLLISRCERSPRDSKYLLKEISPEERILQQTINRAAKKLEKNGRRLMIAKIQDKNLTQRLVYFVQPQRMTKRWQSITAAFLSEATEVPH
jgi:hypothetical protein